MIFTVPTFEQIRDQNLQAIANQNAAAAIGPDSDHFVRASALAAVVEGMYSHQAWVYRQGFADLADADIMEVMANERGLTRKPGETNAALLDRLLFVLRNPPAGGNAADYARWAREVSGVDRAFVYPLRRGDGTVDVVPLPASGLPSAGLLAAVQTYIDALKPVEMPAGGFTAIAPTAIAVPVTATLVLQGGYLLADVVTAVTAVLGAYFRTIAPGETVVLTKLMALISNTSGVADVFLAAPAANVTTTVDAGSVQLAQLGTVTISL